MTNEIHALEENDTYDHDIVIVPLPKDRKVLD